MSEGAKDAPGVVAPPPLIYAAGLLLGLALDSLFPIAVLPDMAQYVAGLVLIGAGILIAISVLRRFKRAGTNLDVRKPTTAIVTTGPFRYSRNPAYVALSLLYAGIGIAADSPWVLGLLIPILVVMHFGVILREERYLERKFGEDYLRYKHSIRRWL
ncbi:MAG: isoprenylcysteine carboxylmethyltransferase family protein [Kiloniellales bacterium]